MKLGAVGLVPASNDIVLERDIAECEYEQLPVVFARQFLLQAAYRLIERRYAAAIDPQSAPFCATREDDRYDAENGLPHKHLQLLASLRLFDCNAKEIDDCDVIMGAAATNVF
jgi:hypothetical protein